MVDLHSALKKQGVLTTRNNLSIVIKQAGYQWKKARVTLTSPDPLYREKVDAIKQALSRLKDDEAFFSIDEFGPFAMKMRGGRALQPPGKRFNEKNSSRFRVKGNRMPFGGMSDPKDVATTSWLISRR